MSTTPTDADRAAAEKIAGEAELEVMAFRSQDPEALDLLNAAMIQLRTDIAQAIADARAVKAGHVRLDTGEEVRVLGTLPMTKDGCVIGDWALPYVHLLDDTIKRGTSRTFTYAWTTTTPGRKENKAYAADMCYSSHTAAEAALAERREG